MDQILSEIKSKLKEIMTSYQFGYDDNECEDYSGADIYLDNRGYIVITVYAEVSYKGLVKIMDALNPVVEKYDSDAYFDAETSGRCSAYIDPDNVPSNMYPYDGIQNSEKIYSDASNILAASKLTHKKFVNLLKRHFKFSEDAANIVANWYEQEDVLGNFDDIDELLNYIDDDIYDMLDASTTEEEYDIVSKYLNIDTNDDREYGEDNNGVENDPSVEDIRRAMNHLPSQFKVTGNNLSYNVAYDSHTVRVAFFLLPGAKYTYTIDGKGPYTTNQEEQINFDLQDYFDRFPITSSTKNIAGASKSNVRATAYANSSQSQYTNRTVLKYKNKSFTIYDNSDSINLPADADFEALRKWKAQISQQAGPYNDADEDYEWASLSNGVVSYYRRGKLVDKSYYMSPSDWGVETLEEWFQLVINDVIENLYEANRDVPDHMVYNSTDIEDVSAGDNPMSFRYKGRRIKLLTDGTGYAIYEKGEMIDYGFKSLEDAEAAIDEYDDIYQDDVQVYSATNDGEGYWFFTTHGVQPGSVPKDVDILDIIDTPNGSFVKFDRFLSTKELNEYDMIEKAPKSVMSSKNCEYDDIYQDDITSSTILDANPEFRNNFEEAIDFFYESYPATVELTDEVDEDYDTLYKAYVKETGSLYQQTPGIVYIDINWDSGEILQALEETAESIGIEHYPDDDIEMSTFSDKNDITSSTIKASYEVELDPEESMIDMNIDQYIIVDSEGSWDYDSDNYNWASSDGEGSDWYSDNGVRLDDPTGVVEKIDELIEPHIPIEPGTYRVEGYIELYYTVSGVYENRYDYTEDDYSSDINSDFGSAEYNKKLSKIENVKVTKI